MQRFFLSPSAFLENSVRIDDAQICKQIGRVLRMQSGDRCIFLDNTGDEYECRIDSIAARRVVAAIIEKRVNENEPRRRVTLYQALPKKAELFELVLQKTTELGIMRIVPLITQRTERSSLPNRERLLRIMKEAAEQSERGRLPLLDPPINFEVAVTQDVGNRFLLHTRTDAPPLRTLIVPSQAPVELFIGPEGGFSEHEVALATQRKIQICGLGNLILRTETAAIVAVGLCFSESPKSVIMQTGGE